jgi:hypothetical protein
MRRILMLAFLLVATASCRTKYQPQAVHVTDPGPPERVAPGIRVVDPGMTPRAPLRYRVAPGTTELLYLDVARARAMQAGNQEAEGGFPPIQLEVKMGPAEPTPQGLIRHGVKIVQVRISKMAEKMSPAQREEMEKTLAPLLQVQGWSEMDVQGRVRRGEFSGMEEVDPALRAMLGNVRTALLTIPFPDEPLGVRARWEVERKVQFSGIWIDQVVTYSLETMKDGQLELQITARQSALPQAIGNSHLEAYEASVIGSATLRLDQFSAYSEAESISQMRIKTQTPTGPEITRVETETAVRLYPADAEPQPSATKSEEKPTDIEDAKVITDPGQQKLRWQ